MMTRKVICGDDLHFGGLEWGDKVDHMHVSGPSARGLRIITIIWNEILSLMMVELVGICCQRGTIY